MRKFIPFCIIFICIHYQLSAQFTNKFITYSTTNTTAFSGNNFKCIWVGKGGQIWAGTQYQGLYTYDTSTKVWTKSAQLTNVFINQIQSDQAGGIWVAQSGTSGVQGGGSNTAGGVNYFPTRTDAGMQFFNTNNILSSRNVRAVYLDTVNAPLAGLRRIWVPQATFTSSGNTAAGGITKWQDLSNNNFQKVYTGLQVFPNTNLVSAGTPSCYTVCGDKDEVWIGAETNYTIATGSTSQILRYDAATGQPLGGYDQNGTFDKTRLYYNNQARVYTDTFSKGILPASFRTTAMYEDAESRRWVGLRSGGVVVKVGNTWKSVNMPTIFPTGTTINFNAITSDEFGYIYIGTSNGLVVFDNGGDVTDIASYKLLTTVDSLPSNNITGLAYDKAAGRMLITSDAGVTFWTIKYKIDVKMMWDFSYPERINNPIGVAADSISRIYLKIKKGSDTLPDIKAVTVSLKRFVAAEANTRGRLKVATEVTKYTEEANTGTSSEVSTSTADLMPDGPGSFWIWYVAPADFSNDSLSAYASLRKRYDTVTVILTYVNNKKDTMDFKIGIVRPPLLLVHGLASSPGAWDYLRHRNYGQWVNYINSPIFTYKRAIKMDPAGLFQKNAAQLLGGDINVYAQYGDRLNTIQGNIEEMRNTMRYAANQVDYVCHSMGGDMIRSSIGFFPDKFFSKAGDPYKYKTYTRGFTHKIITLNTPHNSAPIADIVDQFAPIAPWYINQLLAKAYYYLPDLIPSFLTPKGSVASISNGFKASDAVHNLQCTYARGGINLPLTPARNHLIIGDVNWDQWYDLAAVADGTLTVLYKSMLQTMYAATFFQGEYEQFDPATKEATRAQLRTMIAQAPNFMIFNLLNYMSARRGFDNYLQDGDFIVPLYSQTARQPVTAPNVTKFINTDSIFADDILSSAPHVYITGTNAWHSAMPKRDDVGQRVFQLLNTRLGSPLFSDNIPANNDPETPYLLRPANPGNAGRPATNNAIATYYDTTKIKIDAPVASGNILADSTLKIKFRLKDTARLVYVDVIFQIADSIRVLKTFAQQTIPFTVNPSFTGRNAITVIAVYERVDGSGLDYRVDTISVNAANLATLQGFRVKKDQEDLTVGQPFYPNFEIEYNNTWVNLPNNDPGIAVSIDSVSIVQYDTAFAFNGLKDGAAIANFTYTGFADSILFKVNVPYDYNCINRTVAGGSFKNPAIWSKGVVPDICDSVIISTGHTVTLDTSVIVRALRINSGGTFTINNIAYTLQLGQQDEAHSMADNYGTLNISNGALYINGRMKFNTASTFTMSSGTLTIDANKGIREMSIADSAALFEASTSMASFNFSGGTLQINDPPYGAASQAINCPYDFGSNSILVLGISTSATPSNNVNGFGGLSFPNRIGKLVVNAGTRNGNRQFVNKKSLGIKGSAEVKTGSGIILQAPMNVSQ